MTKYDPSVARFGTADHLIPKRRVDNRTCFVCGARAGHCGHMQADEDIIWVTRTRKVDRTFNRWTFHEVNRVLDMRAAGLSYRLIAEVFNTTEGAIQGVLFRERARR